MASSALEEKINKIRQQNEEIKRRYEEVEEDKKNAAKLNALVQMVPSSDWPERREPPEFSNPPKTKQKPVKEKHEYMPQSHIIEGKKIHSFAQGEGPPPDPKYNFLADSEREEPGVEHAKETSGNRSHNKVIRGSFRKKTGGRESIQKDSKVYKGNYRDDSQPGYDAWRAERNRIDEDRISRQRTAEGNWRREWDNDKMHIIDDVTKKATRPVLADFAKKDHKDSDRRYYTNNNEYANHTRGGSRGSHRGSSKNFYGNYENRSHNTYDQHRNNAAMPAKIPLSPTSEGRTVTATDKSIKVTVNQSNVSKGPMMSVKVNTPNIVGTGRVGPRQRSRVTYSSYLDTEAPMSEVEPFFRQKSFEDKSKGTYFNNQKSPNVKRSQSLKKKDGESKYLYNPRKEMRKEDNDTNSQRHHESEVRSYAQKDLQKSHSAKSPKLMRRNVNAMKQDPSNENVPRKCETRECLNNDSTEHENNVIIENSETLETSKSALIFDQIKVSNTESEEQTDKKEIASDTTAKQETGETSLTTLSHIENFDGITKDDTNINSLENVSDYSQLLVNNLTDDLQNCNMSSEALVPNNVKCEKELVPNESNNVSNGIVELEEEAYSNKDNQQSLEQVSQELVPNESNNVSNDIVQLKEEGLSSKNDPQLLEQVSQELVPNGSNNVSDDIVELGEEALSSKDNQQSLEQVNQELVPNEKNISNNNVKLEVHSSKDDQQSSEQVTEQIANNNFNDIKNEDTEQRSALATTDAAIFSEIETYSVIEAKNQSINNELIEEKAPIAGEKTDESVDNSNINLKNAANSKVNADNILSDVSVNGDSTEMNKEKTEKIQDVEEEL
ncbi:uncharacterized protein LOC143340815 [Colletes latitarsis]|uniref:uncharacterized protein LOC143340815 n=1 Tax=Colletes latitarsis TaxID=2605962 RepID=UPI0040366BF4